MGDGSASPVSLRLQGRCGAAHRIVHVWIVGEGDIEKYVHGIDR